MCHRYARVRAREGECIVRALLAQAAAALREGRMPDHAGELAAFLEHLAEQREAQAQRVRENAKRRAQDMRDCILRALGPWLTDSGRRRLPSVARLQDRIARAGPKEFGLQEVPDAKTVRKALKFAATNMSSLVGRYAAKEHPFTTTAKD